MEQFSEILKIILQLANVVVLGYAAYKFLNKPHDNLADEVKKLREEIVQLKVTIKEMQKSLDASHEKHREQDRTNATFKSVMLAFVDFEIAYCLHTNYEFTEDLNKAKKELQDYLANKN